MSCLHLHQANWPVDFIQISSPSFPPCRQHNNTSAFLCGFCGLRNERHHIWLLWTELSGSGLQGKHLYLGRQAISPCASFSNPLQSYGKGVNAPLSFKVQRDRIDIHPPLPVPAILLCVHLQCLGQSTIVHNQVKALHDILSFLS